MSRYQLAQLNIAVMKEPLESPSMADFVANLERINALAESSPGFVWRLQTEEGDATALRPLGENTLVNMSVWRDVAALEHYVYKSAHVEVMRRRKEWFERMSEAFVVLWWVPHGHRPQIGEAIEHLEHLRRYGPTHSAFGFRNAYPTPDTAEPDVPFSLGDGCPATRAQRRTSEYASMLLPAARTAVAPDGSHVRVLLGLAGGGMAHFELAPGQTSTAVAHRSVEEIWFIIAGRGEMWRSAKGREEVTPLEPGLCLTIPLGTHFQFRAHEDAALAAVAITMPPWPGDGEAVVVPGKWSPTLP